MLHNTANYLIQGVLSGAVLASAYIAQGLFDVPGLERLGSFALVAASAAVLLRIIWIASTRLVPDACRWFASRLDAAGASIKAQIETAQQTNATEKKLFVETLDRNQKNFLDALADERKAKQDNLTVFKSAIDEQTEEIKKQTVAFDKLSDAIKGSPCLASGKHRTEKP